MSMFLRTSAMVAALALAGPALAQTPQDGAAAGGDSTAPATGGATTGGAATGDAAAGGATGAATGDAAAGGATGDAAGGVATGGAATGDAATGAAAGDAAGAAGEPAQEPSPDALPTPEAPAAGLPAGQTGQPGETGQEGEVYIVETFGDWSVRCVRTQEGDDPCQLYQLLEDEAGNSVAEISLFGLPPGNEAAAASTVVTPLLTLLPEGLRLTVDGGEARRYPFSFCTTVGCVAQIGLRDEEVTQFKRGRQAQLVIVPVEARDEPVTLAISLSGFTAGYDAVNARNAGQN